jgi:hypothetical protein
MLRDRKTNPASGGEATASPSKSGGPAYKPLPRPRRFILIADPPAGSPLALVALCGATRDWRVTQEILVHPEDASADDIALLERWVSKRTKKIMLPARNGAMTEVLTWLDEGNVHVSFDSLADFRKRFIRHAYQWCNLVISYDPPRALAAFATRWDAIEKGRLVKGWALEILPPAETKAADTPASAAARSGDSPGACRKRSKRRGPSVFVKILPGGAQIIELRDCGKTGGTEGEAASYHRGQFLSLARLAYALSAEERSFESALAAFTGELFDPGNGPVDHHRRRARASLSLAETLVGIFDLLPVSRGRVGGRLSETNVQSPAGVTRALARHIGLGAPVAPRDRLGASAAAFFGGRIEAHFRGEPPVATVDFSKTYATIAALMGVQSFLAAEEIRLEEATNEARDLARCLGLEDLLSPAIWPRLAVLCWVRLQGEVVPTTLVDDKGRLSNAMARRWSDRLVPLWLPDVIAAKLVPDGTGTAPEIVRAERMVPAGEKRQLGRRRLPSKATLDLSNRDVFCSLVEEGERLKRGDGRWKDVPEAVRKDCLYPAWKAGNNALAFGDLARTDTEDLAGAAREEVTLIYDEGELRVETAKPEDPGPLFCMPLAGLVTAGARLWLAMIDTLVAAKRGTVAAGHTDSAHIIATEAGGTFECDARSPTLGLAGHVAGGCKIPFHALSRAEIDGICEAFRPLTPFDPELMPGSPLKIERTGTKLILTPSHYCHLDEDGRIVDWTMSHLGEYLPPLPPSEGRNWGALAWRFMLAFWRGDTAALAALRQAWPWLRHPAVRALALSQPGFAPPVAPVANRPFERFLVAQAIGQKRGESRITTIAMAPYEPDPARWAALPWRSHATGELFDFDKPDPEGQTWRLRTVEEVLENLTYAHPHAALDYLGRPCEGRTRGPLSRLSIRDGRKFVTGKDRIGWRSDDPANAFGGEMVPEMWPIDGGAQPGEECDWPVVRTAAALIPAARLAKRLEKDVSTVSRWLRGRAKPAEPRKVAAAVAAEVAALDPTMGALLGLGDAASDEAMCAAHPDLAALMQTFLAAAVDFFARIEGIRAAARSASIPEKTLRDWRRDGTSIFTGKIQPLRKTVAIAAKLGRAARGRIKTTRKRFTFWPGVVGDCQAICVAVALAIGEKVGTEPPAPAVLREEMEQFVMWMMCLWVIEAVAAAMGRREA